MSEFINIDNAAAEAKRLGEEVADAYNDGFINNLQKANAQVVKAFKTRYEALNYQREFGLIDEEEYYRRLEQARDAYFGRNTQEWYKYTEEIYSYRKGQIEEYQNFVEDSLSDLIDTAEKKYEVLQGKQDSYKGKLLDYAGSSTGFDTHTTYVDNYWPTGDPLVMVDYTLTDYEKEIERLTEFNDSITKLMERAENIDPEIFAMFFDELRGMSVDDAKILTDLLLKASDEEFSEHFELYDARNTLAENMAASYYSDDYNQLAQELKTQFDSLPEDFFEYGRLMGENLIDGFIEQIDGLVIGMTMAPPVIPAGSEETNIENKSFAPTYYFFGDRAATSKTWIQAKDDSLYSYMAGNE